MATRLSYGHQTPPPSAGETFTQTNLIPWHVNLITAHTGLHKNTAWSSSGVRFTNYLRIVIKPGPNYDVLRF